MSLVAQRDSPLFFNLSELRPNFDVPEFTVTKSTKKNEIIVPEPTKMVNAKVTIYFDSLALKNKNYHLANGYRILMYSGGNQEEATNIKSKVYRLLGNHIDIYTTYKQPDYKIKVGDYLNKFEAYEVLGKLRKISNRAILIAEQISIKKPVLEDIK